MTEESFERGFIFHMRRTITHVLFLFVRESVFTRPSVLITCFRYKVPNRCNIFGISITTYFMQIEIGSIKHVARSGTGRPSLGMIFL